MQLQPLTVQQSTGTDLNKTPKQMPTPSSMHRTPSQACASQHTLSTHTLLGSTAASNQASMLAQGSCRLVMNTGPAVTHSTHRQGCRVCLQLGWVGQTATCRQMVWTIPHLDAEHARCPHWGSSNKKQKQTCLSLSLVALADTFYVLPHTRRGLLFVHCNPSRCCGTNPKLYFNNTVASPCKQQATESHKAAANILHTHAVCSIKPIPEHKATSNSQRQAHNTMC